MYMCYFLKTRWSQSPRWLAIGGSSLSSPITWNIRINLAERKRGVTGKNWMTRKKSWWQENRNFWEFVAMIRLNHLNFGFSTHQSMYSRDLLNKLAVCSCNTQLLAASWPGKEKLFRCLRHEIPTSDRTAIIVYLVLPDHTVVRRHAKWQPQARELQGEKT